MRCTAFTTQLRITFLNTHQLRLCLSATIRTLVVIANHQHRAGMGLIPAGLLIIDFFLTVATFDMCMKSTCV